MAFNATTPYALACLSDTTRAAQSAAILQQEETAEVRVQGLIELAHGWDVPMDEDEAEQVVNEYDNVVAAYKASGRGLGSFNTVAAYGS
jgi:hypothetical protein